MSAGSGEPQCENILNFFYKAHNRALLRDLSSTYTNPLKRYLKRIGSDYARLDAKLWYRLHSDFYENLIFALKSKKKLIDPKIFLGSILGPSKSSFVRGWGSSKNHSFFYHPKSVILEPQKSTENAFNFSYKEIHVQQNSLQTHWD
jgi:hypothetical protein